MSPDRGEVTRLSLGPAEGVGADVTVGRVLGEGRSCRRLSGRDVAVLVVGAQHVHRARQVDGPVLRLAVRAHHPVVAADAEVVLGRDSTGVVQRRLAGEHHGAVRRHHQDSLGVHEHRGLGVPVGLCADVDPGDHDVDLPTALGELDDPAERLGHPVHVLGARIHRDPCSGRQGEPLHRDIEFGRQVERGDDPGAFRLGHRSERLGGIAEQDHPPHALGEARGRRVHDPDHDCGVVLARRALDRHQAWRPDLVEEVVLEPGSAVLDEQWDDLVRIDRAAPPRPGHLLRVVVEGLQPVGRGSAQRDLDPGTGLVEEAGRDGHRLAVRSGHPALGDHLLHAGPHRHRSDGALQRGQLGDLSGDQRPDVQPDVVHVQLHPVLTARLGAAGPPDRLEAGCDRSFGLWQAADLAVAVTKHDRARGPGPSPPAGRRRRCRARRTGTAARRGANRGG